MVAAWCIMTSCKSWNRQSMTTVVSLRSLTGSLEEQSYKAMFRQAKFSLPKLQAFGNYSE